MATHPELEAEQAHVDRAYERLDQLRDDTEELIRSVIDQGRGGTHQFREERDVIVRTSLARLDQLDIGEQALCFGRIDRRDEGDGGGRAPGRRELPHRPPGYLGRGPRAPGGRLAGARGRALLPGHGP